MQILFLIQSTSCNTNNNNINLLSNIQGQQNISAHNRFIQYDLKPSITVTHHLSHTVQQSAIHLPTFFFQKMYIAYLYLNYLFI